MTQPCAPFSDPQWDMEFFCPCVPPRTTSQMKRAARTSSGIRFFKSSAQEAADATLEGVLLPHQPQSPLTGLVEIEAEFTWPWRKADLSTRAKAARAHTSGRLPSGAKPDLDNVVKQFQDRLVSLRFIERDELVCALTVRKFFGSNPGISVKIRRVI